MEHGGARNALILNILSKIEALATNQGVVGSNPAGRAILHIRHPSRWRCAIQGQLCYSARQIDSGDDRRGRGTAGRQTNAVAAAATSWRPPCNPPDCTTRCACSPGQRCGGAEPGGGSGRDARAGRRPGSARCAVERRAALGLPAVLGGTRRLARPLRRPGSGCAGVHARDRPGKRSSGAAVSAAARGCRARSRVLSQPAAALRTAYRCIEALIHRESCP